MKRKKIQKRLRGTENRIRKSNVCAIRIPGEKNGGEAILKMMTVLQI